ncbi:MAG: FAD-dependent oxidoreductase [Bacteroidota bacterium]
MKKIVIVGGGVAGKGLASTLSKKNVEAALVLIDPKEYFEVPYAELRALVQPETFAPTIRQSYKELLPGVTHVQGKVVTFSDTHVTLTNGEQIDMDYLVLATGSSFKKWELLKGEEPTIAERQAQFVAEGEKLASAQSVLIVGGGTIGVEAAGEIAATWPSKRITLVHGGDRLLDALSEKMSKRAAKLLDQLGVEVHTNLYLREQADGTWQSKTGETFNADVVYQAVGMNLNTEWIGPETGIPLTERRAVKVDDHLRVIGKQHIFAIGDINDVPEVKLGAFAGQQATLTAKNLMALLKDPNASLKPYKPNPPMGFVPVGQKKGAVQLPFGHPHFLIAIKQKDLLVSRTLGN